MMLATLADGTRDGRLALVSRDHARVLPSTVAASLQQAIENWEALSPGLRDEQAAVDDGAGVPFRAADAMAPLPRAWQWLDGSAFNSHGDLMSKVFGMDPSPRDVPLMYQGVSDHFYAAHEDVAFPTEDDGIDFEGEFAVIVDETPLGVTSAEAERHIRLIVQVNDWSLRRIAPVEMRTGFGWVQAKPPCSVAPVAVTPDELGSTWQDGRIRLPLRVWWNDGLFGEADAGAMDFGFGDLVAHAARTRRLVAGTIIGSGTVSNGNYRAVGSSCIAERRGIEMEDLGEPRTPFMRFGDRVVMEAKLPNDQPLFGRIDQRVVQTPVNARAVPSGSAVDRT